MDKDLNYWLEKKENSYDLVSLPDKSKSDVHGNDGVHRHVNMTKTVNTNKN